MHERGGERFRGPHARVEQSTKGEPITEVYNGWSSREWEARHRDADGRWTTTAASFDGLADFYTGAVVATQRGGENHAMRWFMGRRDCVFDGASSSYKPVSYFILQWRAKRLEAPGPWAVC